MGGIGNCCMKTIENAHQTSHTLKAEAMLQKKIYLESKGLRLQILFLVDVNKT